MTKRVQGEKEIAMICKRLAKERGGGGVFIRLLREERILSGETQQQKRGIDRQISEGLEESFWECGRGRQRIAIE